jgi:hypothetical protein
VKNKGPDIALHAVYLTANQNDNRDREVGTALAVCN